ncbi:MAG: IS66 family transposase [Acidobacteria bacterium]|nr:IS66 family transposase [Acidobacteriota bacterium]
MPILITEEIFQAFLKCETKAYLKYPSASGVQREGSDWQRRLIEDFRQKCAINLRSQLPEDECLVGASLPQITENGKHRLVIDCLAQAREIQSSIHALERLTSPDRSKHNPYIPIRFLPSEKVTRHDKLLLAFDALALSLASGKMPPFGKIIHGSARKSLKVQVAELMKTTRSVVERIAAQQESTSPPPLILNKHCAECAFQARCRQVAIEKDELSLLSGMTEKERKKQHDKGIFTVTQLSYTFRPRRKLKRLASRPEKYYPELKALALRERKIHIAGKPELNITGTPVYLDVEGVPDRDFYYLIGLRIKSGDSFTQHSFWADDAAEEKEIWASFLHTLAQIENPQLLHYGSYETVFLKRMKERYGAAADNPAFVDQLIAGSVNLLSVIYARIYFPTYSNGLKEIAQYLGFQWSDEAATGAHSLIWRSKWEYTAAFDLKQKLITYNAEDCEALEWVTEAVTRLCLNRNEPIKPKDDNVVHTDSLKGKSSYHFGENCFSLPEFEKINQSAYWNYQRDKIYVRSNPRLKQITKKSPVRRQRWLPANTVINCPAPEYCPECLSTSLYKHGTFRKIVYDLKFSRTGVKRWVVRYQFHRYICRTCAATFNAQPQNQTKSKHGLNLLTHIIYQLVELKIPQGTIAHSLNQLFDLRLGRNAVIKQKTRAAEIYQVTYERILKRILSGRLIHADETKVNIRRGSGYVWVLTNLEEVAYLYTDTREGELVQSLLREFKGVLVTDFYAAYDSIDCPQQKCLIHLMRDLNDDLLKQPFNEELKGLTQAFAALLKPMIETIDRFGLKAHYLRKHKAFVARFYQKLSKSDFKTELVVKYKKRFEKNRGKLFTFLDYDGVPWNNNNAEHAIKAFAMLRTAIRGASSEKGIREYLTLLSVCETCKYKGVSFLKFLRSGEKDVDEFIKKINHL